MTLQPTKPVGAAAVTAMTWIAAGVFSVTTNIAIAALLALALMGGVQLASHRRTTADASVTAVASLVLAGVIVLLALAVTGKPVLEEPRYVHGQGDFPIVASLVFHVPAASLSCAVGFTAAAFAVRHGAAAVMVASRMLGLIAVAGLVALGSFSAIRSLHGWPADDWVRGQPVVFDLKHHSSWIDDSKGPDGETAKHAVIEHGITVYLRCSAAPPCGTRVVFPSGTVASAFALYHPNIIRHATRERLWIISSDSPTSEAAFDDQGHSAGDISFKRIAATVAPPRSYMVPLVVGLVLSLQALARAKRAIPKVTGSGPYREAIESPTWSPGSPEQLLLGAQAAAFACLGGAPTLGWCLGLWL